MNRSRKRIMAMLLCFCLLTPFFSGRVMAQSSLIKPILPETESSLTLSYQVGDRVLSACSVKLYRVAEVSAGATYTWTSAFQSYGLVVNGIQSSREWNALRTTLEARIISHGILEDAKAQTNQEGKVCFDALQTGLYLAIADSAVQGEQGLRFDSALISVPQAGQDGNWQYQVSVQAKGEEISPPDPEEQIEFHVIKLWKGDEGENARPQEIEVEIFRNGTLYDTVFLSQENHWSHRWTVMQDGSEWTVMEKAVPRGYTLTVEKRENTFVLTNTLTPEEPEVPEEPIDPPQTGDSSHVLLYTFLLILSGCALIALGAIGRGRTE